MNTYVLTINELSIDRNFNYWHLYNLWQICSCVCSTSLWPASLSSYYWKKINFSFFLWKLHQKNFKSLEAWLRLHWTWRLNCSKFWLKLRQLYQGLNAKKLSKRQIITKNKNHITLNIYALKVQTNLLLKNAKSWFNILLEINHFSWDPFKCFRFIVNINCI